MATIETNEAAAIGFAVREAMIDDVLPIIQERPAAVIEREPVGMGWLRDLPDFRDYTSENVKIVPHLEAIGIAQPEDLAVPAKVDLRAYCSPVEDQGSLGSCTANAVVGLVEYFERRAFGKYIDASRLFLYKATRELLHWTGDTGAYLRSTIGALALFGVPPEEYWPYKITNFDTEPTAFCYAFANDFRAISYFRLDDISTSPPALITKIKAGLAAGLPCVFGFTVYSSIAQAAKSGRIPYPVAGEEGARRPRDARDRLRRQHDDRQLDHGQDDEGRAAHPQLVGAQLGRPRLRRTSVRVRPQPARGRLLVAHEGGLDRHGPVPGLDD